MRVTPAGVTLVVVGEPTQEYLLHQQRKQNILMIENSSVESMADSTVSIKKGKRDVQSRTTVLEVTKL